MECVILAGGLATRVRPYTERRPKVLLPVAGEPFTGHQLSWLAGQGVRRAIYCIGYLGEQIREYVGDGTRWGVDVAYVDEGAQLMGTGGAVRLAVDSGELHGDAFLVLYGDSYLDIEVAAVCNRFAESGLPALMTVIANDGALGPSNADYDDGLVLCYDKEHAGGAHAALTYVDYGLSVFTHAIVRERIPAHEHFDLADLQSQLSRDGLLAGFVADQRFCEIGSIEGWRSLDERLGGAARSRSE